MDILRPRYPPHIAEGIISFLEFKGHYTRAELEMWAELNSYPYLKRRIAKKLSILLFITVIKHDTEEQTIDYYLEDETVEFLSRCTSSFFILFRCQRLRNPRCFQTPNMTQNERNQLQTDLNLGEGCFIIDVFDFFKSRAHAREKVLHSFEFMRFMKEEQCSPESMFVIQRWPTKLEAIRSLFLPPRLLPKSDFRYETSKLCPATEPFTNPQSDEVRDFADNIYFKEDYPCKIESFWKRLVMVSKIKLDFNYWKKSRKWTRYCIDDNGGHVWRCYFPI